ncbi:unnamed protein product, partial [Timema podura]|nr:unnamed protein product [Timema podura]
VGGFSESGKGTPEDLIFFYRHLDHDGRLIKVPRCLLVYRYHPGATTFSIDEAVEMGSGKIHCPQLGMNPQISGPELKTLTPRQLKSTK